MTPPRQTLRFVTIAVLIAGTALAQEDASHRRLKRAPMGFRDAQMRLELLQRLQQIAKERQERGQPPIDPTKLTKEVKEALENVQAQDRRLKEKLAREQDRQTRDQSSAADPSSVPGRGPAEGPVNSSEDRSGSATQPNEIPSTDLDELVRRFKEKQRRLREDRRNANGRNGVTVPRESGQGARREPSMTGRNSGSNRDTRGNLRANNRSATNRVTPSQRPLSQNEVDNFDIAEYMKRLNELGPLPGRSKIDPPRSPRRGGAGGTRSEPSPRPRGGGSTVGRGKSTDLLSNRPWKKLLESAKKPQPPVRSQSERNDPDGSRPDATGAGTSPRSPSGSTSDTKSSGGGAFAEAFRKTAEGAYDHIDDIVRHQRQKRRTNRRATSSTRRSKNGLFDSIKKAGDKTGEFFGNASRRGRNTGFGRVSMPSAPEPQSFIPFIIVAVVVAAGWFALRIANAARQSELALAAGPPVRMPAGIHSRQDVIDAFHVIATRSPAVKGNWWTHSRAARALRKIMPAKDDDLSQLTRVYETARYLPPDSELSAEQLQTAREAIARCAE